MKKYVFILLSIVLLISLTACGKQDETAVGNDIDDELFYVSELLAEVKMDEVLDFSLSRDGLILMSQHEGLRGKSVKIGFDGSMISEIIYHLWSDAFYPVAASIDAEGNTWFLCQSFGNDEITAYLEIFGPAGNHLKSISPDLSGFPAFLLSFTLSLLINTDTENGNVSFYLSASDSERGYAAGYDSDGAFLFGLDRIQELMALPDGRIIARRITEQSASDKIVFIEVDAAAGSLGDEYRLDSHVGTHFLSGGGQYDILEVGREAVYGLRLTDGLRTKLIDWMRQGIFYSATDRLGRFIIVSGDDIYRLERSSAGTVHIHKFTLADNQDGAENEKRVITLANLNGLTDAMKGTVVSFNKSNPDYEIQLINYEEMAHYSLDLAAGNVPDISVMAHSLARYADKGFFVDLYEFIDNDPDISREDYVPNLLKMLETDGKLYTITESFNIGTVIGKTKEVGEKMGWSWDDFTALMDSKPGGTIAMGGNQFDSVMSGEEILPLLLWGSGYRYVDVRSGTCHFDSPDFIALLEATKKYFPEIRGANITFDDYREGRIVLMPRTLWGFTWHNVTEYDSRFFGEEITYIGYPTMDGTGASSFLYGYNLAISNQSDVKEGAWEYLKYVLTDYQYDIAANFLLFGFPFKLSALAEAADNGMHGMNDGSDSNNMYFHPPGEIRVPDENDIMKIYDLIDSITVRNDSDWRFDLMPIIEEEVPAFYKGQKTAAEVAKIIQNRASLYLKEMD